MQDRACFRYFQAARQLFVRQQNRGWGGGVEGQSNDKAPPNSTNLQQETCVKSTNAINDTIYTSRCGCALTKNINIELSAVWCLVNFSSTAGASARFHKAGGRLLFHANIAVALTSKTSVGSTCAPRCIFTWSQIIRQPAIIGCRYDSPHKPQKRSAQLSVETAASL